MHPTSILFSYTIACPVTPPLAVRGDSSATGEISLEREFLGWFKFKDGLSHPRLCEKKISLIATSVAFPKMGPDYT